MQIGVSRLCSCCFSDSNGVANLTALGLGLRAIAGLSTHLLILICSLFVLISSCKAWHSLLFIIVSSRIAVAINLFNLYYLLMFV